MKVEEACRKAETLLWDGVEITHCLADHDTFLFNTDFIGADTITPDMPIIQVSKKTGVAAIVDTYELHLNQTQKWRVFFARAKVVKLPNRKTSKDKT